MIGVKSNSSSRTEGAADHLFFAENGMYFLKLLFSFERSCGALAQLGEPALRVVEVVALIPRLQPIKHSSIVHWKFEYLRYQIYM